MKKVSLEDVEMALKQASLDDSKIQEIKDHIQNIASTEQDAKDAVSEKTKYEYVVLVSNELGNVPDNLVGWVVQIPEGETPLVCKEKICKAAANFNMSKKGRELPVKSVGETIECIPSKFFKEEDIKIKTKIPVYISPITNKLDDVSVE